MAKELKPCPMTIGNAALENLMDRKGIRNILEEIRDGDPEVWRDICETTGQDAISAMGDRPEAALVRVKALIWSTLGADPSCIASPFPYQIWPNNGGSGAPDDPFIEFNNFRVFEPFMMNCVGDEYETLDEAKAAAQADYERRVLAALEPDTVTGWQDISIERSRSAGSQGSAILTWGGTECLSNTM